jgi:hypothetical protein
LDCLDEYYGVLPWTQHELCGFVEKTDAATTGSTSRVWISNLVTSYTETFKNADGTVHFRKVSLAFLISVSFTRQITVLTHTPVTVYIADEKAVTSLDVEVLGDALYDVASKQTIINFMTTFAWPYQIQDIELPATWTKYLGNTETEDIIATAILNPNQPDECDQTQDTTCEQSWILTIQTYFSANTVQVCDLHGRLEFTTFALDCRDYATVGACEGAPQTNFTIAIGKTDLCDKNDVVSDASKGLTVGIETYYDAEHSVPQSVFQTGDAVFFKLHVVDPSSTIDQITFRQIRAYATTEHDLSIVYEVVNAGDLPSSATIDNNVFFNLTQELREPFLLPNNVGELHFNFRLMRKMLEDLNDLSSVDTDSMTKQLTVEATIDILYHGNQKRSIVASTQVPAMAHTTLSFYDMGETEEELAPHANDAGYESPFESNLFGESSAASVAASCVAVVAAAAVILA